MWAVVRERQALADALARYLAALGLEPRARALDPETILARLAPDARKARERGAAFRNLVGAGVSQAVAMAISGHKTASVFRRYDITNEADIAAALELVAADIARKRKRERHVETLPENAAIHGH